MKRNLNTPFPIHTPMLLRGNKYRCICDGDRDLHWHVMECLWPESSLLLLGGKLFHLKIYLCQRRCSLPFYCYCLAACSSSGWRDRARCRGKLCHFAMCVLTMQTYFIHEYGNGNFPIELRCIENEVHPVPIVYENMRCMGMAL